MYVIYPDVFTLMTILAGMVRFVMYIRVAFWPKSSTKNVLALNKLHKLRLKFRIIYQLMLFD